MLVCGFCFLMDKLTDRRTDIGDYRVVFATENNDFSPVVFDHHLRLELPVLRSRVLLGRSEAGVKVREGGQLVPELGGRGQRQEDLGAAAVGGDLRNFDELSPLVLFHVQVESFALNL